MTIMTTFQLLCTALYCFVLLYTALYDAIPMLTMINMASHLPDFPLRRTNTSRRARMIRPRPPPTAVLMEEHDLKFGAS